MRLLILFILIAGGGFSQGRYISKCKKMYIFERDGGKCKCCGDKDTLEYDHVIPYSCGGLSDTANIQLLCRRCNRSKSNGCVCGVHYKVIGNGCCDRKKRVIIK